jgi:hypothetical protein
MWIITILEHRNKILYMGIDLTQSRAPEGARRALGRVDYPKLC